MANQYIFCIIVASCWAGAAFLGRASQLNAWIIAILLITGGIITIIPLVYFHFDNLLSITNKGLSLGLAGGVVNTLGVIAWYKLISGGNEGLWNLSSTLPIAVVLLAVSLVIGGRLFFGDVITNERLLGLTMACGAIWFLR